MNLPVVLYLVNLDLRVLKLFCQRLVAYRDWGIGMKYLFYWSFRATTFCFAPEILVHLHSIVAGSLQVTNR